MSTVDSRLYLSTMTSLTDSHSLSPCFRLVRCALNLFNYHQIGSILWDLHYPSRKQNTTIQGVSFGKIGLMLLTRYSLKVICTHCTNLGGFFLWEKRKVDPPSRGLTDKREEAFDYWRPRRVTCAVSSRGHQSLQAVAGRVFYRSRFTSQYFTWVVRKFTGSHFCLRQCNERCTGYALALMAVAGLQ